MAGVPEQAMKQYPTDAPLVTLRRFEDWSEAREFLKRNATAWLRDGTPLFFARDVLRLDAELPAGYPGGRGGIWVMEREKRTRKGMPKKSEMGKSSRRRQYKRKVRCFKCERLLFCGSAKPADDDELWSCPYPASVAVGGGNYGSTLYDSLMDGVGFQIAICDDCLKKHKKLLREIKVNPPLRIRKLNKAEMRQLRRDMRKRRLEKEREDEKTTTA